MGARSIYEQILGENFHKLHPKIQQRFGFNSTHNLASIGRGVMDRIWISPYAKVPLQLYGMRNILLPQGGVNVPFSIENYAYRDRFGREMVTWIRKFRFKNRIRRFDAAMFYSEGLRGIVDYLGNKHHLAVDLSVSVEANGGIRIRSGEQRVYEHRLQFRLPRILTGTADVCEWYDDEAGQYKISVAVVNPLLGPVFRYDGSFRAQFVQVCPSIIPIDALPLREESRE
jgi:hypothetical protein